MTDAELMKDCRMANAEYERENDRLRARVQELLEANTRLVNERREATMLRDEVRAFARMAGQPLPIVPTIPDEETLRLRGALDCEELSEKLSAMGLAKASELVREAKFVCASEPWSRLNFDMIGVFDGACDLAVTNEGSMSAFGVDSQPGLREAMRSNMSKFIGGVVRDARGKILKGPHYSPPDLRRALIAQGWQP